MRLRPIHLAIIFAALPSLSMAQPASGIARDSELCRSQLELLIRGKKLTEAEIAVFERQCACLAEQEQSAPDARKSCAEGE